MTERIFHVRPAYDCIRVQPCVHGSVQCKPGSSRSHGVHNAEMHLSVKGPLAEITLVISTGWDLPSVPQRPKDYPCGKWVNIHTATPRFAGQTPCSDTTCPYWVTCYSDIGFTIADEPTLLLVEKGSDAVWTWLESFYATILDDMRAVS